MNFTSLDEEANALIQKQEEFREKSIAERSSLLARIADLDALLEKLGAKKKRAPRVRTEEAGGEGVGPLDEEDDENRPSKTTKVDLLLQLIQKRGPQSKEQVMNFFPHETSIERQRTYTLIYQLKSSKKLVENKLGQLEIPNR